MDKNKLKKQLNKIKAKKKITRKTNYRKNSSRLDKYKGEIMYMRQVEEATYREIQTWLLDYKHIDVHRSTIYRRIELWINGER